MPKTLRKLYECEGKLGFDFEGFFITDPFVTECQRFIADPIKDYGLTKEQVEEFKKKGVNAHE